MGQAKVPADPKPKTCSQKYKSMNLQMTLKTFPATLKMMLPTGPQQLTKYICLVYFLFDVSFFFPSNFQVILRCVFWQEKNFILILPCNISVFKILGLSGAILCRYYK